MNRNGSFRMSVYLLLLLMLSFSCSQEKATQTKTTSLETSPDSLAKDAHTKLKYTSGIRAILHDSKGNYWFGSHQEGACLFDGKSFTYFTVKEGLNDNQVRTIQEDSEGVIWFGTANGVNSYHRGIIKNHTAKNAFTGDQQALKSNWELTAKDLWFNAGNKSGVYRLNGQKLSYLAFPIQGDENTFNLYGVTGFSKGKKGNLWIATYAAVFGYDGQTFEIIDDKYLGFTENNETLHVRSILEDSKGNVWIGNNGIGVLLKSGDSIINFSKKNGLIHAKSAGTGAWSPSGTLEHVFVIKEDSDGNIWFGDRDTGAWRYDGKTMTNYTIDSKTPMIWDIYQDKDGNLLFAMADGGVYVFDEGSFERKY